MAQRLPKVANSPFDPSFNKVLTCELESSFAEGKFRCSALPYCPILDKLHGHEKGVDSFPMSFYVNIGTAVHEVVQRFLPHVNPKEIWGNWKCRKTEKIYSHCTFYKAKKAAGHDQLDYVEVDLDYKGLTGHIDLLLKKKLKQGSKIVSEYHLADIKTTSDSIVKYADAKYYPSKKYLVQLSTYCALMRLCFDIRIKTMTIVYVSRNVLEGKAHDKHRNTWNFRSFCYEFTEEDFADVKAKIKRALRGRSLVVESRKTNKLDKSTVKAIFENRPCQDKASYTGYGKHAFFNTDCEYCNMCTEGRIPLDLKKLITP